MPTIEPLSKAASDYLAAFNLAAVCVSATGRVYVGNPAGASLAFWCKADDVNKLATAAWRTADVPAAAHRLNIPITPHAVVISRVAKRTERIEQAIEAAKADGLMQQFHSEYRRRRLQAKARGKRYMSFRVAERKLHKAVADAIAADGTIKASFISRVLDTK
jgi:hypothetical protein